MTEGTQRVSSDPLLTTPGPVENRALLVLPDLRAGLTAGRQGPL